MKLVRVGPVGHENPGLIDAAGHIRDLSDHIDDLSGDMLDPSALANLSSLHTETCPKLPPDTRLGPPVANVGKIICIGLNYHDHAREVGKQAPDEPMLFLKAPSSICGPTDPIEVADDAAKLDWEVELGIVIGRRAKAIGAANVHAYIAGYVTANDVSERAWQGERSGQFTKGKSHDTFCPLGPWLVTPDEIADVMALPLWTEVNGSIMQDGTTADMVFDVAQSVSYISHFMTLEPGDIVLTGTPAGVGKGQKPDPIYLKPEDRMRCAVVGLGEQDHRLVAVSS